MSQMIGSAGQGNATGRDLHELLRSVYHLKAVVDMGMDLVHERSGMSSPWKRVLRMLSEGDDLTVPDIAMRSEVSRQFVLKTCNDMAEAGLVEYADNPRHKRSKLVRMTRAGQAAYAATQEKEHEIIERILPGVDAAAVRNAAVLLDDLRERMLNVGLDGVLGQG